MHELTNEPKKTEVKRQRRLNASHVDIPLAAVQNYIERHPNLAPRSISVDLFKQNQPAPAEKEVVDHLYSVRKKFSNVEKPASARRRFSSMENSTKTQYEQPSVPAVAPPKQDSVKKKLNNAIFQVVKEPD